MTKTLIFFLFSVCTLCSQEYTLNGKVLNHENEPISFVSILLLKKADSTFFSGTATEENGNFSIQNIPKGVYTLKASFIGFKEFYFDVDIDSNLDLGTLILKEGSENLDEVTLNVHKPIIQRDPDKLIFNVENSSVSSGSTWEILGKTPGVIIQQNSITIKNQPATVYINDRKVNLNSEELKSLLQSFSGSNVSSVEVITNPSARYDADSGMVLNIVTSKSIMPGYKGDISTNYTQAIFPKYKFGSSHFFKNEHVNLFVDYSYSKRKEHKNDLGEISFFEPDMSVNSFWETDFQRITHKDIHNINASLDYYLSPKTTLNFTSFASYEPKIEFNNTETAIIFSPEKTVDSLFVTSSNLEADKMNLAFDLSINHNFNDKGTKLSTNAHYTNFDYSNLQNLNTNYFLPNGNFLNQNSFSTDSEQKIDILVGQIDFETKLLGIALETGLKASFINSKSGIDFFDVQNNSNQNISFLSDNFKYEEKVYAGYIGLAKNWDKWSALFSIRGEQTETKGNSIALDQISIKDYFDFFPNVSLNYSPNGNHSVTLAYKKSITRPNYDLLNPFRYYINENNFTSGNPHLKPSLTDRFSISYLVEGAFEFEFYYRTTVDDIEVLAFQDNANRFLNSVSANMEGRKGYGLNFSYATSIRPWWFYSNYFALFHEENSFLAIESNNQKVTLNSDGFFIQLYNGFTLSKDRTFTGNLTFIHLTGIVAGTYKMNSFSTLSLGLRKSLWNNRASISISANDLFDTTNRKLQTDYLNQKNSYFAKLETQYVQLGFIYNFGNFNLNESSREISNDERNRID
ncbi:outer membrane beta-barrel protein [Planktosalinus lacus]|uniref:TonB-dependent receptor n=1 Tax=Planktosalinus lacus TaxID=1526573 RepID=A0A8J2Y671_9FLAO|nr:outer membrane beta-barrel family protein [Planktosalinus lacus]GGD80449.1 TonB-dependent receptor [Planktosalinus lacus]